MLELMYGTMREEKNASLHFKYFSSQEKALQFIEAEDPQVAQITFDNGNIWVVKDNEEV